MGIALGALSMTGSLKETLAPASRWSVVIKDDSNDLDNCFDDGNQVPYDQTSKIPGKARVETFTCLERNHLVMVSSIIKVTVTLAGADQ